MSAETEEIVSQQSKPEPETGNQSDRELSEEELAQASGGVVQIYRPHYNLFRGQDQRANQLYNILTTVLKNQEETKDLVSMY